MLRVTDAVSIPEDELRWRFSRAGGPGGQGVNTTDSRVELVFDVGASRSLSERQRRLLIDRLGLDPGDAQIRVVASEHRSQLRNREAAEQRLAGRLAGALAPPPPARRPTTPSRAARARRLDAKRHRARTKRLRGRPED
jgi:ribosome-associated protein